MTWTRETPTEPGWYWYRDREEPEPAIYRVSRTTGGDLLVVWTDCGIDWELAHLARHAVGAEWCGPLEVPS